jgi:hypothetical protein
MQFLLWSKLHLVFIFIFINLCNAFTIIVRELVFFNNDIHISLFSKEDNFFLSFTNLRKLHWIFSWNVMKTLLMLSNV